MRTTLRLQNSVRIQHPAKFNLVLNELVMEIMLSASSRSESLLYAQYIEILLITRVRATKNLILCDDQHS